MEESTGVPFELQLLSQAVRYQHWVADAVGPSLGKRIFEVGAGIGNLSRWLPLRERLVLSEWDDSLRATLEETVSQRFGADPRVSTMKVDLRQKFVEELRPLHLDTIVSFNVLEHIEDDHAVLDRFARVLAASPAPGPKRIVTFVPAHAWAFGSLDKAFGHYRRYDVSRFRRWARTTVIAGKLRVRHFNLLGLGPWFVMNRVMRSTHFNPKGVQVFERLCPWVRDADDFLHERLRLPLGQSLLAVWTLAS